MHADGQPDLERQVAAGVEPALLGIVRPAVLVGMVEPDLADRDHARPSRQVAEQPDVRAGLVERVVAHGSPHPRPALRPLGHLPAGGSVHAHGDQVGDARGAGLGEDVVQLALDLFQVDVGVDQPQSGHSALSSSRW